MKGIFVGETEEEILSKVKAHPDTWEDITSQLEGTAEYYQGITGITDERREEMEDNDEFDPDLITMDMITSLYHDGDSTDGYTLMEAI